MVDRLLIIPLEMISAMRIAMPQINLAFLPKRSLPSGIKFDEVTNVLVLVRTPWGPRHTLPRPCPSFPGGYLGPNAEKLIKIKVVRYGTEEKYLKDDWKSERAGLEDYILHMFYFALTCPMCRRGPMLN